MNDFDNAVEQALKHSKYNILTGRVVDIRQYLTDIIVNFIKKLLDMLNIDIPIGQMNEVNAAVYIFLAVVGILLIVIIGVLVSIFLRRRRKVQSSEIWDLMSDMEGSFEHRDLVARSNHYASSGNYRESVRYRFIAMLMALHKHEILKVYKTKTNRQIMRDLKNAYPAFYKPFCGADHVFNITWFGNKAIEREALSEYCHEIDDLIREVCNEKPC